MSASWARRLAVILGLCLLCRPTDARNGVAAASLCAGRHDVVFSPHGDTLSRTKVAAVACATEGVRDLTARQPITVRLVDAADLRSEAALIRKRDVAAESLDATSRALVLLGALSPDQSLSQIRSSQYSGNTTAQYDIHSKILYVRVDAPAYTPLDRALISHEFTLALLDQHFNLSTLVGPHKDAGGWNFDAQLAAEALVEGDAYTTMLNFAATTFSRQDLVLFNQQLQRPSNPPPDFAHDQIGFPAAQGTNFVRAIMQAAAKGKHGDAAAQAANKALDTAMQHPPTSTSEILNPAQYMQHSTSPAAAETVDPLDLGPQWTEVDSDVMGAFGISDLLSQNGTKSTGTQAAALAGSTWQSDRWVVYKDGAASLMVWKAHFTTVEGAQAFVHALSSYTAARYHA
ncbi:MAG: hypothetical protein ACRDG4_18260, partial [Chloroflexota bacterium]